jgi:hypothetical protein
MHDDDDPRHSFQKEYIQVGTIATVVVNFHLYYPTHTSIRRNTEIAIISSSCIYAFHHELILI